MSVCVYSRVFSVTVTAGPSVPSSSWAYTLILYCVLAFRLLKQCLLAPPPSFVSCFWPSAGTNIDSLPFEKGRRVCPGSVCSVGKCFIWTCSVREEIKKWKPDTTKHSLLFYKNIIIVLQADCFFYTFGLHVFPSLSTPQTADWNRWVMMTQTDSWMPPYMPHVV